MNVIDIDLSTIKGRDTVIKSGDLLIIDSTVKQQEMHVSLLGHCITLVSFYGKKELKISDLVKNIEALKPNADLDFALIHRELPPVGEIETLFVDLRAVLSDKQSAANFNLLPRDKLIVFSNKTNRARQVAEIVDSPITI